MPKVILPTPEVVGALDGEFNIKYGPQALTANAVFSTSLGAVIANMAEAERHLEAIMIALAGADSRVMAVFFQSFKGHKNLLSNISAILKETGNSENHETFKVLMDTLKDVWAVRDKLAHGIWASCDRYPNKAILISGRNFGKVEGRARELLREGDFLGANSEYNHIGGEAWSATDFEKGSAAAAGVVNSLMGFSACLSQPPAEAMWIHTLLRRHILLPAPIWTMKS